VSGRVAVATVALVLSACGSDAADVLSETGANMSEIESGQMLLRLTAAAADEEEAPVGFELRGPFALPDEGDLPVAELEYTQLAGDESETVTFISTGEAAFVEVDGVAYELPPEQVAELRGGPEQEAENVFDEVGIDDWIRDPVLSDGEEVDGDPTDQVSGSLDVIVALNDLFELGERFGGSDLPRIEGAAGRQLEGAVQDSSMSVLTGREDRLLRQLEMEVDLAPQLPPELQEIEVVSGANVSLSVTLTDLNETVEVEEPSESHPYTELVP
jgi:hypothetical protein